MIADIQTQDLALDIAAEQQYVLVEQAELIHVGGGEMVHGY